MRSEHFLYLIAIPRTDTPRVNEKIFDVGGERNAFGGKISSSLNNLSESIDIPLYGTFMI